MVDPEELVEPPDEYKPDEGPAIETEQPGIVDNVKALAEPIENDQMEAIGTAGDVRTAKPMAALDVVPAAENPPLQCLIANKTTGLGWNQ